jgi:hypothetical protein
MTYLNRTAFQFIQPASPPVEPYPDAPDDWFQSSPIERIRAFFSEQNPAHRATRRVAENWERFLLSDQLQQRDYFIVLSDVNTSPYARLLNSDTFILSHEILHALAVGYTGELFVPNEMMVTDNVVRISTDDSLRPQSKSQLSLSLEGDFSPSSDLVEHWVESVRALAQDANIAAPSIAIPNSSELHEQFSRILQNILGTIAQQLRYSDFRRTAITKEGQFTPDLEIQICDAFFIRPSRANAFLSLLKNELTAAVGAGLRFEGAWGHIELTSDEDLIYVLTPRRILRDSSFADSIEVD